MIELLFTAIGIIVFIRIFWFITFGLLRLALRIVGRFIWLGSASLPIAYDRIDVQSNRE